MAGKRKPKQLLGIVEQALAAANGDAAAAAIAAAATAKACAEAGAAVLDEAPPAPLGDLNVGGRPGSASARGPRLDRRRVARCARRGRLRRGRRRDDSNVRGAACAAEPDAGAARAGVPVAWRRAPPAGAS